MYFYGSSIANIGGSYVIVLASSFALSAMWYVALKLALLALSKIHHGIGYKLKNPADHILQCRK